MADRALLAREVARDGHIVYVRPELWSRSRSTTCRRSPQYPGGLALRFARVKGYRPDKAAAEADTIEPFVGVGEFTSGGAAGPSGVDG